MPVYRLPESSDIFPHPFEADPSGISAVGGELSTRRLLTAYLHGIFPWFSEHEPPIWWFPDPRCVLFPADLKVSKSMRSVLRNGGFRTTFNSGFIEVIRACQKTPRRDQEGTWLTEEMVDAYCELHRLGYAHSVEVWLNGELVGGLYGIGLGKIFFGESMFTHVSNASKVSFIRLVQALEAIGVRLVDCQQDTPHLRSLGAVTISSEEFYGYIRQNLRDYLVDPRISLSGFSDSLSDS